VTSAVVAQGLTKHYRGAEVVRSLDLRIDPGEIFGLVGPNGSGKTTTIRMLLGLVHPSGGHVEILGSPPGAETLARVGAIVEEPAFWKHLSGRKNLEYMARAGGRGRETDRRLERIDDVLGNVGLSAAAGKKVRAYSQGMRQRLGIALATLGDPDVLLLDEPTNGLDPRGMIQVRELLRRLRDKGAAILVSSHLLGEIQTICDRVGFMSSGRLVAQGPPASLVEPPTRVRIKVQDRRRAAQAVTELRSGVDLGAVEPGPGWLTVELDGISPSEFNARLIAAGVEVEALAPDPDPLEAAYLSLIDRDDVRG
jgi:ABC-2 type transport system ATP-binding protein